DRRDPVTAIEHVHGVLVLAAPDEEDRDDRRQQPEGPNDEREEDPGRWVRPAGADRDGVDADAQDHRADVFGRGRFEQVRAPTGENGTTRKAGSARPGSATWTGCTRRRRAAAEVRTFYLPLVDMAVRRSAIEHAAPTRNAAAVRQPRSIAKVGVSATSFVSK